MDFLARLRLLAEFAPLLGELQKIGGAKTPHEQAVAVMAAVKWAVGRTETKIDDELTEKVAAVLASPQGKDLFETIWNLVAGGAK